MQNNSLRYQHSMDSFSPKFQSPSTLLKKLSVMTRPISVLVRVSVAVIKYHDKSKLVGSAVISPYSLSFIIQGSWGQNQRYGLGGRNQWRPWSSVVYQLAPYRCSTYILITPTTTIGHTELCLPISNRSLIKNMYQVLSHRPVWVGAF